MKRFGLWLTMAVMFSLPALVFAQATGGSTDSKVKNTSGKKSTHKQTAKKGTKTSPKVTGTGSDYNEAAKTKQ